MRTHLEILKDAGPEAIHEKGIAASLHTARSWLQREHIPPAAFDGFVAAGLATFEELFAGARPRKARVQQVAA